MEIERRCRNAALHDGGREGGRERGRRRTERWGSRAGGEEKETRYILYDSVIAFPRTNIARRPSGRKKTSALIVALSTPSPRFTSLARSLPRFSTSPRANPRSSPPRNFSGREGERRERFAKRSLPLFVVGRCRRCRRGDRLFLHANSLPPRTSLPIAGNFNRRDL